MNTNTQNFRSAADQHSTMSQVIKQLNQQINANGGDLKQRHLHTGMNTNVGALILLMAMATVLMAGQSMNSIQKQLKIAENQQTNINKQLENITETELPDAMNLSSSNLATVNTFQQQISREQSALEVVSNNVQGQAMLAQQDASMEKGAYQIGKKASDEQLKMSGAEYYQTAYRKG